MSIQDATLKAITGKSRTAAEVQIYVYDKTGRFLSESAVTARIRDLRKVRFGGHTVKCLHIHAHGRNRYEYRVAK